MAAGTGGRRGPTRRGALLAAVGAGGLLAGCETLGDAADSLFSRRKTPLPGERLPVLAVERGLDVDAGGPPFQLPPPREVADWPQAGGVPSHAPGHPALGPPPLVQAWSVSVGSGSAYRRRLVAPPVVAGGTAFAVDAYGLVTAVEAARGRRLWQKDTRPRRDRDGALGGGCAAADGALYVATGMAEAMALDPADGSERWRVALPAPARGAPTVAGGRVFVPTVENQLLALSAADGERQWTHRAQPTATLTLGLPAPAVEGEVVVAGFGSGELVALRAADGRLVWSETLTSARGGGVSDIAAISALPVVDRGRVFAAGLGGIVIALDLRSGRRLWEREVASGETPWAAGDALFLVTTGGDLVGFGRDDGRVRWTRSLGRFADERRRRDPITWGPPALAGGRLVVAGSHGRLLQLDPEGGEPIGAPMRLPGGAILAPAFAGGAMLLLTEDAALVSLQGAAAAA